MPTTYEENTRKKLTELNSSFLKLRNRVDQLSKRMSKEEAESPVAALDKLAEMSGALNRLNKAVVELGERIGQLEKKQGSPEESEQPGFQKPASIRSRGDLRAFVLWSPEFGEAWAKAPASGEENKHKAQKLRDALVLAYPEEFDLLQNWTYDVRPLDRHIDAFFLVHTQEYVDFARDVDGIGAFWNKLQWFVNAVDHQIAPTKQRALI
jgi:hypothetical protein